MHLGERGFAVVRVDQHAIRQHLLTIADPVDRRQRRGVALGLAGGRPCRNLDFYLQPYAEILDSFARHAAGADVALVEGNKGLYDGLDLAGSNSNAALSELLGLPVVLVLDARGMTRGIAPLILGYQAFDPALVVLAGSWIGTRAGWERRWR